MHSRRRKLARVVAVVVALVLGALGVWWFGHAGDRLQVEGVAPEVRFVHPSPSDLAPAPIRPKDPIGNRSDPEPRPPIEIHGIVVDEQTRAAIVGAGVWRVSRPTDSDPSGGKAVVTDHDGKFVLPVFGSHEGPSRLPPVILAALARGYRPLVRAEALGDSIVDVRIELTRGASIEGSVVDENGIGIAGATIRAMGVLGEEVRWITGGDSVPFTLTRPPDFGSALSDAEGHFVISGLVEGHGYRLVARHPGHANPFPQGPPPPFDRPGQLALIHMQRLFGIRTLVVDADTGAPVRGSSVRLNLDRRIDLNTDAAFLDSIFANLSSGGIASDGPTRFVSAIRGTEVPSIVVRAGAPGYEGVEVTLPMERWPAAPRTIPLRRAQADHVRELPVIVAFQGGREFDGLLAVSYGLPRTNTAHGALLRFLGGRSMDTLPIDTSVKSVEFGIRGFGESGEYWDRPAPRQFVDVTAIDALRFELRGGRVRLRVRDDSGDVLTGFTLSITGGESIGAPETWLADLKEPGFIAPDGSMSLWLDPMTVRLQVRKVGYRAAKRDVIVAADGSTVDVDVVLESY